MSKEQWVKLLTVAWNTSFSPRDAREYGVRVRIDRLVRKGWVKRVARGKYVVTEAGYLEAGK